MSIRGKPNKDAWTLNPADFGANSTPAPDSLYMMEEDSGQLQNSGIDAPLYPSDANTGVFSGDASSGDSYLSLTSGSSQIVDWLASTWGITSFPFTFAVIVRSSVDRPAAQSIIGVGVDGVVNVRYDGGIASNEQPQVTARNTTEINEPVGAAFNNGNWRLLTFVFEAATNRRVYLDNLNTAQDINSVPLASIDQARIGARPDDTPSHYADIEIAAAMVWKDAALSTAMIQTDLWNGGDCFEFLDDVVDPPEDVRFTCNGALSLGDSHKDIIDKIQSSMAGRLSYSGGQWTTRASVWKASSESFTADDIVGPMRVQGSATSNERFNIIRGFYIDPEREYEAVEFPHVSRAAYVTRDNDRELEADLQLPMTNDGLMAQRIGFRVLEQSNNQIVVQCSVSSKGATVKIGDVVDVTFGELSWVSKTFRVIGWEPGENDTYALTLHEDNEASYNEPSDADYGIVTANTPTVPDGVVPPPTNLTAHPVSGGNKLNWDNPSGLTFDFIDVYMSGDANWVNAERIASVRSDSHFDPAPLLDVRYYWVRARLKNGSVSDRVPDSDVSTVTSTAGNADGCTFGVLPGQSLFHNVTDPSNANCGIRLNANGDVETRTGTGGWTDVGSWIGSCLNTSYEARMTLLSGDAYTTGTPGTWQALSSTRTWELLQSNPGGSVNQGRLEIRRTEDDLIGRVAIIDMESDVE